MKITKSVLLTVIEDYVLITTDKKYKDCIKDKILNSTVSGFAINDYDERLVIEVKI